METSVVLDFLGDLHRTHMCGDLRASHAGQTVLLMGWAHRRRDHGAVIFIDMRDRTGHTQAIFHEDVDPAVHKRAEEVRAEQKGEGGAERDSGYENTSATTNAPSCSRRFTSQEPTMPEAPVTKTRRRDQAIYDHTFHGAVPLAQRSSSSFFSRASFSTHWKTE